jgi:ubiquinone/menaquinone biosynthesis C-methylase UbiE
MTKKRSNFTGRYRRLGREMLAEAFRLRAGVAFDYTQYPGLLEEITRTLSGRILDVGAAGGWLVDYLRKRKREVYGVDSDMANLAGSFMSAGDPQALPFRDGCFDGVFSGFCLTYVEDKEAALDEFARVLVPLGDVVILMHHPESGIRDQHKKYLQYYEEHTAELKADPKHREQWTLSSAFIAGLIDDEDDLRTMLVKAGFRIKSLRREEGKKGHLFSSIVMKDVPVHKVFWLVRATRDISWVGKKVPQD